MADPSSRKGERYAQPELLDWLDALHTPHDVALQAAYEANEHHGIPAIHVGAAEGKLLGLLLQLNGAKRVVEVGTLAGYSAIWMARALPADGRLWTLERDPKHAEVACANLAAAGVADRVEVVVGDGMESLRSIADHAPFCAVFVDADKERYDQYGRWALEHLRPGGLLLGDNAYAFGKLLADDERGRAMRAFHEEAAAALDTVCAPTPDGLLIGRKR
ncbi:MAG: methyltransferase [Sandaracinus sp.]|mgnify:CR=1 FL=1|nr:methyltransferase [Sandaracinus sp.]MAQ16707.1 methyltransferase [Sandaracinus sp.]